MPPWYRHYDTYAAVDLLHQFVKMKFKGREVVINADGKIISSNEEFNPQKTKKLLGQYEQVEANPLETKVKQAVAYLKSKGKYSVEYQLMCEILNLPNLRGQTGAGSILKGLGAKYDDQKKIYDLSPINQ